MNNRTDKNLPSNNALACEEPTVSPFPKRVTVELTNHCNLRCTVCPRQYMKSPQGYISFELFKKIIDEISEYQDVALIPFFHGESMLHPEFIRMLAYAKKRGIAPIQLTTNATRMNKEMARALVDLEIDFVSFSIDSVDPDTYCRMRVGATLDKVLANVEYFCNYKKKAQVKTPEVQVSVVRTEDNQAEVDGFVQHWQQRVDRIRVFEQHSSNGNFGSLDPTHSDLTFDRRLPCLKVFNEISIYWNGLVALCCHDWDRVNFIGDVNQSSLKEVWTNEVYAKIRRTHVIDIDQMEELCQNCDQWKVYYLPQRVGALGQLYTQQPTAEVLPRS